MGGLTNKYWPRKGIQQLVQLNTSHTMLYQMNMRTREQFGGNHVPLTFL